MHLMDVVHFFKKYGQFLLGIIGDPCSFIIGTALKVQKVSFLFIHLKASLVQGLAQVLRRNIRFQRFFVADFLFQVIGVPEGQHDTADGIDDHDPGQKEA